MSNKRKEEEMKKLILLSFTLALFFASYAENDKAEAPKMNNYKQVLSEIEYPQVCREKGIEGKVIVMLRISAQGEITDYEFKAAPCTDLEEVVEASLPKMKFTPATDKDGNAIAGIITFPVNFKLTI